MSLLTLKELAALLNLAPSTVSRALQGHPDISKSTQKRVKAAAQRLQYHPSIIAQGLRSRNFQLIAVILPELTNPFYAKALQGIIEYANEKNYRVLIYESREDCQKEAAICYSLEKSGIDGLLLCPTQTARPFIHLERLKQAHLPLACFGRIPGNFQTDKVIGDDYYGAHLAVNYLIRQGCRKIAHLAASQQWVWAQKRQWGYIQALREHHLPVERQLILEYASPEEIKGRLEKLTTAHRIDGIFGADDSSAAIALNALHRLKYRIPQDIAVCGYGNTPLSSFTYPNLTTIDPNIKEIGTKAAELLLHRIQEKGEKEPQTILLKNRLIIRDSTPVLKPDEFI